MPNANLNVTISGGVAPVSLQVRFVLPNGTHLDITSPTSFSHSFTSLTTGNYDVFISGMNPSGGSTVSTLTVDPGITMNGPDKSPCTSTAGTFLVQFNFDVP
jgi:hypothetical protein